VAVEQAPLWGLGRVIALEHPEIWGGLVDLGVDEPATSVAAELFAASDEDQVAYRGGVRHGLRLTPTAPPIPAEPRLRADGSYLITGGRGALGVRIADWLVEHGARHLILTGRAAVPQRQHWGAELRRLEERGATVRLVSADVGDERAMAEVLDVHPPVRGIVHAAGVFEPQALATMTPEELGRVLRPKVRGTAVLDRLTRGRDLDFFVLFSSAAAVWGSALAAHYVAANHFEDAVAHARRRAGEPALSVDWGWWAGSEMVPAEAQAYFAAIGLDVIPEQLGFAALERLLASDVVQQTVAPVDWRRFKPVFEAKRRRPLLDLIELPADDAAGTTASTDGLALLERLRRTPGAARREIAVQFLQTEVGVVLGRAATDLVDPQLGFFEAGMDSITAVELKGRLETTFGIVLPATAAFEYPNVVALAEYLVDAFGLEDAVEDGDGPLENLSEQDLLTLLAREVGAETVR
jgi:NAD(P)-dependent dehydrogenase (short-subunit alcohol dehydrogenase family)/acyl carrier protein